MARILVLEDSLLSRQILKKALKPTGHEVIEAANGNEGLEKIAREAVDCILLDLGMPGLNGEETLAILQQQGSRIPAIVISADIQETTRQRCLDLGAFAVLHKIVNPDELLRTLNSALNLSAGAPL
jgi:CheY-like chemotaxis protein